MYNKKIFQKIYAKIDSIAKKGILGKVEYDIYINEIVDDGQFYILRDVLDRKYGIITANEMTVDEVKNKTYTVVRLRTSSSFQEDVKTLLDKSNLYQVGKDIYSDINSTKIGTIESTSYGFSASNLTSLQYTNIVAYNNSYVSISLEDPNMELIDKYKDAVDFLLQYAPTTTTTTTSTTTTTTTLVSPN